jgi:amidase
MGPLAYQNANALLRQLRSGEISSSELVLESIRRIERYDNQINAVVVRDFDRAREAALKADKALARAESGALLGLPITIKESYSVAGFSKSWGVAGFEKKVEVTDGVVAKRLKKEGAIILGKTNVPTYLGDWQTYNDIYGVTNNPWNLSLTAGGSSGGSAAALAAGFSSLDFGSDLNGSLRVPAHCCGIYAHNPSYGLVPQRGHEPPGYQQLSVARGMEFAVNGPLARCAEDLELGLKLIAGPDDDMAMAYKLSLPKSRHKKLKDFRVLLLSQHPFLRTSNDVEAALEECAAHLIRQGVAVERSAVGHLDLENIASTFLQQLMALLNVDLSDEEYKKAQAEAAKLPSDIQNLEALVLRGRVLSYRDFNRIGRIRTQLRHQWRELFKHFDVVLCPVMPIPAFPHDYSPDLNTRSLMVDAQRIPYGAVGMWCSLATLTGQPSTVMPIGQSREGLPIGMQIIGPFLEDLTTIGFAQCLEREFGGFRPPPALS